MKKIENSFAVTGRICRDAEIHLFEIVKVAHFSIVSMIVGLIVCYAFGTAWFMIVYSRANGAVGLATVLGWCVIPFIIPDIIKIVLAYGLSRKLRKFVA